MEFKRSSNRYVGGVCGGIAEYLKVNPIFIRTAWVLLTIITFVLPGLIVYIILWSTILPSEKENH